MTNPLIMSVDYTNHRGERRKRMIQPTGQTLFTSNQWHTTPQWLFTAIDLESNEVKHFAFASLHGPKETILGDGDFAITLSGAKELVKQHEALKTELETVKGFGRQADAELASANDQITALNAENLKLNLFLNECVAKSGDPVQVGP